MTSKVSLAARHLIRHLQNRLEAGQERAYLTSAAKACLRALVLQARSAKRRAQARPRQPGAAANRKPGGQTLSRQNLVHAEAPVARARTVLTPVGATKEAQLADLKGRISSDGEAHLPTLRQTMVFSVGNIDADLMFIGEAPGSEEERLQQPFVGPAGQLLTKIIQAMGLQREATYISNIVKFRPAMPNQGGGNRKPTTEEMQACLPYIMAEIDIVQPRVIVAAGATAAAGLTGSNTTVGRARAQVRSWKGIPFVVTYHPSYLLHNNALSERRKVWEDMLLAMEVLQLPISQKQRQYFTGGG